MSYPKPWWKQRKAPKVAKLYRETPSPTGLDLLIRPARYREGWVWGVFLDGELQSEHREKHLARSAMMGLAEKNGLRF